MHLGESGGYVICEKEASWGPKAREKEGPETVLEFKDLRRGLWVADLSLKQHHSNQKLD